MSTIFSNLIAISAWCSFVYAAFSDIRTLRIPNSICVAVAVLGLLRLLLFWSFGDLTTTGVLETLITSVIILFIGLVAFALRFVGGGDVKLLTATVLLIGYHDFFLFITMMSIFGAVLAVVLLGLKYSPLPLCLGPKFAAFAITNTKVMVPYGVPISLAGSITLLAQFYTNTY